MSISESNSNGPRKNILEIQTVQPMTFKNLFEALREIILDTNIIFTEKGMKIITMDTTLVLLVHMDLNAKEFEHFYCGEDEIKVGVNILSLYKIIRTVNSSDTLSFFIDANNRNELGICFDNKEKLSKVTTWMNLMDLKIPDYKIGPSTFDNIITLPSVDFQKICKDMKNFSKSVEMKSHNKKLILSINGDYCRQEIIRYSSDLEGGVGIDEDTDLAKTDNIIQGEFNLEYLCLFAKCTSLSKTVDLYLKNDYALIIKYFVSSLGEIKFCLAPKVKE